MKVKFSNVQVFFIGILLGSALPALAQDGMPTQGPSEAKEINVHPELNANDDKTFVFESADVKPNGTANATVAKEVVLPKAKSKPAEVKAGEKEEQDPMAFNFLYYLIQKFKFSDMVD
jgi:hypothetical protein